MSRLKMMREGFHRYSGARFLGALILLVVTTPFVRHLDAGDVIQAVLMTVVLLSAVLAVGGRRKTLIVGTCLVAPAVAGKWIDHFRPDLIPPAVIFGIGLVFIAFIIVHHLLFVLHAPRVNSEVLCAGISTFLMMGLFWTLAYILVGRLDPAAFVFSTGPPEHRVMAGFEALYYSLTTLSGVSFGDIMPVTAVSRMLSMVEAMVGMFYLAILIARLVSLYSAEPKK